MAIGPRAALDLGLDPAIDERRDDPGRSAPSTRRGSTRGAGVSTNPHLDLVEEEEPELDLSLSSDDDEEKAARLLAESRKKRAAILQKFGSTTTHQGPTAGPVPAPPSPPSPEKGGGGAVITSTVQLVAVESDRAPPSMFDEDDEEAWERREGGGRDVDMGGEDVERDDSEGFYKAMIGEVVAGRYKVLGVHGRGVFSTVLDCEDLLATSTAEGGSGAADDEEVTSALRRGEMVVDRVAAATTALRVGSSKRVAVKVIRANESFRRSGENEVQHLKSIAAADPDGKYHCVRLLHVTEHRSHACLVFEPCTLNLKEVQNKFGKGVGLSISIIQSYTRQLLLALALLSKLKVIHADIKPHNILANATYHVIKLADFGSAMGEAESEPTPLLVARYYRAPEIILGLKPTTAVDTWSAACCLYELYTGSPLVPGADNNDMLWKMQRLKGRVSGKLVRAHLRQVEGMGFEQHFTPDLRFLHRGVDPITRSSITRVIDPPAAPLDSLEAMLISYRAEGDDRRLVSAFKDLLESMTALDPSKRIPVLEALQHPFITMKPGTK